jgi:uncharacterized membrane protein
LATVEESIEVEVPVRTAYNQWTQFEEFPRFMEGVQSVTQLDDTHLRWRGQVSGEQREWTAQIVEQQPDSRIEWRATDGAAGPHGLVTFRSLEHGRTLVSACFEYDPEGFKESVGSLVGSDSRRVQGDLERFKDFVEERSRETGAWRGEVQEGATTRGSTDTAQ